MSSWSAEEEAELRELGPSSFAASSSRSYDACRFKYARLLTKAPRLVDKAVGEFHWREANRYLGGMQRLSERAKSSQDRGRIVLDVDAPIGVVFLSDAHIGDWSTDYDLFERITDEILGTPNLYIALLGDMAHMAIKLRGVAEVTSNLLPPELQLSYFTSWLDEVGERILLCTWDNHAVEREELGSGISAFKRLQAKRFVYFNGIGHPDVQVGGETYKFALSHRFRGRSTVHPAAAPMNYLVREGHQREIAVQGDFHIPAILQFVHGDMEKLAMVTGSTQTRSPYARRHFSLMTHPIFPVLELHPDRHLAVPYWNVKAWQGSRS
jgi:hypothetical protein